MAANENKAKITARIWQSIAQSGIQLSSIPKDQLDTLVSAIADGVLQALDDMLYDIGMPQRPTRAAAAPAGEEAMVWKGRPLFSLVERYRVTTERVVIDKGLFSRSHEDIELVRLQDIDYEQGFFQRLLNTGNIIVRSSDASDPVVTLRRVTGPGKVHEIIRRGMLSARQRYRFSFQEEMTSRPGR